MALVRCKLKRTNIGWCHCSWNPITGCSYISLGCLNCYAARIAHRFHRGWGKAAFCPERLVQPLHSRQSYRIFAVSAGDLGHKTVKPEWREAMYNVMRAAPWHTYIVVTRRPGPWLAELPEGVWAGVSVESAKFIPRVDTLLEYHKGINFVSAEPLLGPVSFKDYSLDWVIAGPETGPKARFCNDKWIEALDEESSCFFDHREDGWIRREYPRRMKRGRRGFPK